MKKIEFVQPNPQDWATLKQITAIDRQAFAEDGISVFNLAQFTRSEAVFCLQVDNIVVAEAVVLRNFHNAGAVVFGFAVDQKYQGKGYGSILMQRLLQASRSSGIKYLELTMNPDNIAARALYVDKFGFVKIEELMPHPQKSEPRWLLQLEL